MLIKPIIFADELAEGYLGRVILMNGFRNYGEGVARLCEDVASLNSEYKNISCLEMLAKISGFSLKKLVITHTTLPIARAFGKRILNLEDENSYKTGVPICQYSYFLKFNLMLCKNCMTEDVKNYGFSYWRRSHQMPGRYWCQKHGTGLVMVNSNPALIDPIAALNYLPIVNSSSKWISKQMEDPFVQKFIQLIEFISIQEKSTHQKYIIAALMIQKARISSSKNKKDELMSIAIHEKFDAEWLEKVSPTFFSEEYQRKLIAMDNEWKAFRRYKTEDFLLLSMALFDDPMDVFVEIFKIKNKKALIFKNPLSENQVRLFDPCKFKIVE